MIPPDDTMPDDEWDEESTAPDDAEGPDLDTSLEDALDDDEAEPEAGDFWFGDQTDEEL